MYIREKTGSGLLILPAEIICHILCFLDPIDVVRVRWVSRQFRDITYDSEIWKTLYATARLPRPPGPFPFQSTQFLERTLIRSAQISKTWTTQPIRKIPRLTIPMDVSSENPPEIVCGNWLLTKTTTDDSSITSMIVLHDIETGRKQVILEQPESEPQIASWSATSVITVDGCTVYILLCTYRVNDHPNTDATLLECRMDINTGQVLSCVHLHVPATSNSDACIYTNEGPCLILPWLDLVFDTRTRLFYKFPKFKIELPVHADKPPIGVGRRQVIPTTTHILLLSFFRIVNGNGSKLLIQAFVPPDPPHAEAVGVDHSSMGTHEGPPPPPPFLRLTHEGLLATYHTSLRLVRTSVVDRMSGSTTIRLIQSLGSHRESLYNLLDVTLPKPLRVNGDDEDKDNDGNGNNDDTVLPMKIAIQRIDNLSGLRGNLRFYASHDGFVRGIHWHNLSEGEVTMVTFTMDASHQDGRVSVETGTWAPVRLHDVRIFQCGSWQFWDGGRVLSKERGGDDDGNGESNVVVCDLR